MRYHISAVSLGALAGIHAQTLLLEYDTSQAIHRLKCFVCMGNSSQICLQNFCESCFEVCHDRDHKLTVMQCTMVDNRLEVLFTDGTPANL